MSFLRRYRQYDDLPLEKLVAEAERDRERRRRDLARVDVLDLARTERVDLPDSEVVNAAIAALRGPINLPPDRHASDLRSALAEDLRVDASRIVVGAGVSELVERTVAALARSASVAIPWPSHPLLPVAVERAGKKPLPIKREREEIVAAAKAGHDLLICNPDDPTGHYFCADELRAVSEALPPERLLVVDEALVDFQSAEPRDAVLRLTETRPVVCLRSFSKAFGLAGLRVGYAVLPPTYADRASALAPLLGVSVAAVAAARHALARRVLVEAYVEQVRRERERLSAELRRRRFEVAPSETNFLWVAPPDGDGTSFARRLDRLGIRVTPGVALGDGRRVRIAVRDRATSERLLQALDRID